MAGGRQHRAFIGARFSRLIVDPVPPSVHALLHHTTSSFYHVVPVVRARVYTPTYHDVTVLLVVAGQGSEACRTPRGFFASGTITRVI